MPFPSPEQASVIDHRGDPLIVVAGPGTGKTRTLVERMISLLREDSAREVTFITFTRASRRDTETKLRMTLGDPVLDQRGLIFPRTSTLHTYAKRLLHRYAHLVDRDNSFSVLIDERAERGLVVREVATDLGVPVDQQQLSDAIAEYRARSEWPTSSPVPHSARPAIIARFEQLLRLYRTFDMEGLVLAASQVLSSGESALPELFLQVDEYQDLNPADQRFVSLLAAHPESEVVIVGDDAQSIYGRRFANYEGLRGLWNNEGWETVRFRESHRLPAHVLNAGLDLIAGKGYLGGEIEHKPEEGRAIPVLQCTNADLQIEAIARDIEARRATPVEEGMPQLRYGDCLVLCPTKGQVEQMVRSLTADFGIPARAPSRSPITDAYWSVILLLRIAHDGDPLALRQWLPSLGLAQEEITRLRDQALDRALPFTEVCLSVRDPRIDAFHGRVQVLRDGCVAPSSLLDALGHIEGAVIPPDLPALLHANARDDGSLPSISHLIHLIYEHFGVLEADDLDADADCVLVTTMHGAKGLEAECVYCSWLNSTLMPVPGRDPEEERRVLYVAMTRAKRHLVLTYPEAYDQLRHRRLGQEVISPFLAEIIGRLQVFRATAALIRTNPLPWQ